VSGPTGDEPGVTLFGIAGSHGVAIGPAVVIERADRAFPRRTIRQTEADDEFRRFEAAVADVQAGWRAMIGKLPEGRPEGAILDAYVLMVGDGLLAREVRTQIHEQRRSAEWAVATAVRGLAQQLFAVDDPYLRERSHDVDFVGHQLVRSMIAAAAPKSDADGQSIRVSEAAIVVAHDLSPADTAAMHSSGVLGFVTEVGSRTSHTSIMARALEIPAVVGVEGALARVAPGDLLIVDGLRGTVVVRPNDAELDEAHRRTARYRAMAEKLSKSRDVPAATQEGTRVKLGANIELPDESRVALEHGAEGVGLYRTEFLYVDKKAPPSEEQQLEAFRKVVSAMGERPVTLRTFDIGGDKFVSSFKLPSELNPMLGLRAVRLALTEPEVLLAHLRAMVRASAFGTVRVMVPLVCTVDELAQVRALLEQAQAEVRARGQAAAARIPLGAMIETPAAAMTADLFAREADFLSIGTNDLVQYAVAVDRGNRALAHLATPLQPSVLRLIDGVLKAGDEHRCPVSVCGQMASEPLGALLLVGLGVRELSMEPLAIPEVKAALSRVRLDELEAIAAQALASRSARAVEELLGDALEPRVHDLVTGQPAPESVRSPVSSSRLRK
jgi:phosphoenolpyruvate-protein phosphotransferase (PTS system enzyme I)